LPCKIRDINCRPTCANIRDVVSQNKKAPGSSTLGHVTPLPYSGGLTRYHLPILITGSIQVNTLFAVDTIDPSRIWFGRCAVVAEGTENFHGPPPQFPAALSSEPSSANEKWFPWLPTMM